MASESITTDIATADSYANQIQSLQSQSVPPKVTIANTNISEISDGANLNMEVFKKFNNAQTDIKAYGADISNYTQKVIEKDNEVGHNISGG